MKKISFSWKILLIVLGTVLAVSGCSDNGSSTVHGSAPDDDQGASGFSVPQAIQSAAIDPTCVTAWLTIDGGPREQMPISNNTASIEKSLTPGEHTFLIEFECGDSNYGNVLLASVERSATLAPGRNELTINDQDYMPLPDSDGDTITNLTELENGTDPSEKLAIVFVSIDDPNASDNLDPNNGTKALPFSSINAAIDYLVAAGPEAIPGQVRVASGTYEVNYQNSTHVVLQEGISLYGGYSLDWSQRDASANNTIIRDTSTFGGVTDNPNRAVEATNSITTSTVIDGFSIEGGAGDLSAAIFMSSASPTISNNRIHGGFAAGRSRGVSAINNSSPAILNNTIVGGSAPNAKGVLNKNGSAALIEYNNIRGGTNNSAGSLAMGIHNNGGTANTIIRNNDIRSGLSPETGYGIVASGTNSLGQIYNNVISGNEESGGMYTSGLRVSGNPGGLIANNTIIGGEADPSGGGAISEAIGLIAGATPQIQNNLLITPKTDQFDTFCITEDIDSDPSLLRNNNFYGCFALYLDEQSNFITDISAVNNLTDIATSGNISLDPVVVNGQSRDWRLTVHTPGEVATGGVDLSADFTVDKDGNNRGASWSIGAYNPSDLLPERVTIDFDGVSPNDFNVFAEDGLTFTPVQNGDVVASGTVRINDFVSTGDNMAFPNFGFNIQDIILRREDAGPFSLLSLDVIEATSIDPPGASTFVLTGTKVGGATVTRTITTDGVAGYETFPLFGLTGLISVRLGDGASTDTAAIDDLVIEYGGGSEPVGNKVAFITSVTGTGDLSSWAEAGGATGISAANAVCQARAAAAGLNNPTSFAAWLSDENNDAYCNIHNLTGKKADNCGQTALPVAAGPWVRTDGFPFAPTIDLLAQGVVYTPIRYDEFGALVSQTNGSYSATLPDGTLHSNNPIPCQNWTSTTGTTSVRLGHKDGTTSIWSGFFSNSCVTQGSLICMETDVGPQLPQFTTNGRTVFITSVSGSGDLSSWTDSQGQTGVGAGDAICQTRASMAGLPNSGNYKAWLSTTGQNAIDRLASNGPWVRPDGVVVANNKTDLTDGTLFTAITQDENSVYRGHNGAWTGTFADGLATVNTCNDWSDGTATMTGTQGTSSLASEDWSSWGGGQTCDGTWLHLYCFED